MQGARSMTIQITEDVLRDFAASVVIWEEMADLAITTGQPGDGRHEAFKAVAEDFRTKFNEQATRLGATREQIEYALGFAEHYRQFSREHVKKSVGNN